MLRATKVSKRPFGVNLRQSPDRLPRQRSADPLQKRTEAGVRASAAPMKPGKASFLLTRLFRRHIWTVFLCSFKEMAQFADVCVCVHARVSVTQLIRRKRTCFHF